MRSGDVGHQCTVRVIQCAESDVVVPVARKMTLRCENTAPHRTECGTMKPRFSVARRANGGIVLSFEWTALLQLLSAGMQVATANKVAEPRPIYSS